ncbi:hypothetical protein XENTR_v10015293 [Xenopus tropicalis]|nr:hypothetical protein XENTR_v10015293 [Xenopus tropicalis]
MGPTKAQYLPTLPLTNTSLSPSSFCRCNCPSPILAFPWHPWYCPVLLFQSVLPCYSPCISAPWPVSQHKCPHPRLHLWAGHYGRVVHEGTDIAPWFWVTENTRDLTALYPYSWHTGHLDCTNTLPCTTAPGHYCHHPHISV